MTGTTLRGILEDAGISQVDFGRLVGVSKFAVAFWLAGRRKIPGSVEAYLRLYDLLPPVLKQYELGRLKFKGGQ